MMVKKTFTLKRTIHGPIVEWLGKHNLSVLRDCSAEDRLLMNIGQPGRFLQRQERVMLWLEATSSRVEITIPPDVSLMNMAEELGRWIEVNYKLPVELQNWSGPLYRRYLD